MKEEVRGQLAISWGSYQKRLEGAFWVRASFWIWIYTAVT